MNKFQRFIFKELNIRGQHVQLDIEWQKIIKDRNYPKKLVELFGELTALAIMLASGMKHAGKLSLQISGNGYIKLLVVEVRQDNATGDNSDLKIRGVAKTNDLVGDKSFDELLDELLDESSILVSLNNSNSNTVYQSHVTCKGNNISEAFEIFFMNSEQLKTKLWLQANSNSISGMLIQRMPDNKKLKEDKIDKEDKDGWNRINILAGSVTADELLSLSTESLLNRLFNEEVIEIFSPSKVIYECKNDKRKTDSLLLSMGYDEVMKVLVKEKKIIIYNDMCNEYQHYNEYDIKKLFNKSLK